MNENRTIIISPHFSNNTYLVANLCKMCYIQGDEVKITSINSSFLKKYDPDEYLNLKIPEITQTDEKICLGLDDENVIRFNDNLDGVILKSLCSNIPNNIQFSNKILSKHRMQKSTRKKLKNENQQSVRQQRNHIHHNATHCPELEALPIDKNEKTMALYSRKITRRMINIPIVKEGEIQSFSRNTHTYQTSMNGLTKIERTVMNDINKNTKIQFGDKVNQLETKISKWIPPISPHNLIEERFYHDPWALLVVTIFLNKTSCNMASPYMNKFFENFKGPYDVLKTDVLELEPYFYKIGLVRTRATQIWRMSYDFIHKDWKSVKELYGVGKYAEDAYKMFHLGDFNVEPTDRYLRIYKAWYEMTRKQADKGTFSNNFQVYVEDYYVEPENNENPIDDNIKKNLNR
ncbi:hypothetical protein WA026_012605 [Henosepilachna vigintioctopunctata]|uniref:HhH-GPD domain-containing protein n=1 Tax=Henosepilachna vigintioctopunctata TaxID=420089 RepID=A0AAW1U6R2_9CUCU